MAEERNTEVSGTVVFLNPLAVVADGATAITTADRLSEVTGLSVGGRVQLQDRSPRKPLVVGRIQPETEQEA